MERRDVYDLLIAHEAADDKPDVAAIFQLMEQSRARDLQDRIKPRWTGLEDLRRNMPSDTLILEYWLGESSLVAVWISKDGAGLLRRPLSANDLAALNELPQVLADPRRGDWYSKAAACSVLLLNGIDAVGENHFRRLVVVPDGALARIPFEVLPVASARGSLLIDRVSVSYLPFAGAFQNRTGRRAVFPPWKRTLSAFADPVPNSTGNELVATERNRSLPDAEREARNVAEAVGGRCELHLGREARKSYLNDELKSPAPLLHLATHAFADPEDPERSYILFAPAKGGQGFDYLFLKEAAGLHVSGVSLVTLSACDSGSGKITRGEGVQSFGSTFLAAGARAVLTSLWRIGDRSSAELMTRFYESLAEGENGADALREAKLAFRHSGTSAAHPAYWAAFVLTGDAHVRIPQVIGWKALAGAAVGAMVLFAVYRRLRKWGERE